MKQIFKALLILCLSISVACAQNVSVTSANLTDVSGATVSNATITFSPVLVNGQPVSFRKGSSNGQTIIRPVSATVTSGAFTINLIDSALTSPLNICYAATVTDNVTGASLLGPGYSCVQPSSTSTSWCSLVGSTYVCNFDQYQPNLAPQLPIQTGPTGPPGPTGPQGPIGAPTSGVNLSTTTNQALAGPITTAIAYRLTAGTDVNTITACGYYDLQSPVNGPGALTAWIKLQVVCSGDPRYVTQIAYDMYGTNASYIRSSNAGTWDAWQLVTPFASTGALSNSVGFEESSSVLPGCAPSSACVTGTGIFPVTQPDTSYQFVCTINGNTTGQPVILTVGTKNTTFASVVFYNLSTTTAVSDGSIDCLLTR
jgi:hypothetical protein